MRNNILQTKIAQKIVDKGGAQRDIDNIVKEAMGNFATDINKLDNPTSKVFTPDYLEKVIDKKDVWAATIKKENVQSDYIERGLNKATVVQVLKELDSKQREILTLFGTQKYVTSNPNCFSFPIILSSFKGS